MRRKRGLEVFVLWLILLVLPLSSHGATCFLTSVADKSTAIPGGSGNFAGFQDPVISNGDVVFIGNNSLSQRGVYAKINGTLNRVADTSTPIPGGSGNFGVFDSCVISNGNIAFVGYGPGQGPEQQRGVYAKINGILNRVADTSTPIPGGSGNFIDFLSLVISGGNIAFVGYGPGQQQGIYTNIGGVLNRLADKSTPVPGGSGNFSMFTQVVISNGNVAFLGYNSSAQPGIYTSIGGALNRLADAGTPIPGGSGNFVDFGDPVISNGIVAFVGQGIGERGIYTNIDGALNRLADTSTPVPPGGSGDFEGFLYPAIDNGRVAFVGLNSGGMPGIYTNIGGTLNRLADTNTPIPDGSDDFFVSFGPAKISDGNVAFKASGSGGQSGIYAGMGGGLSRLADTRTPIPGGSGDFTTFQNPVINNGYVAFTGSGDGQGGIYIGSCPIPWTGSVSFPVRITSVDNASGDSKFQNLTNHFSGKIEAYVGGNGFVPNEDGCYIKFSGDDKTAICIKHAGSASTDVQKNRTDRLLLVGTGEMTLPIEGVLKPGVAYVDFKGALKKDGSGSVVSIGLNGKLGCSGSDFVCSGSYRSTLTEEK